MKNKKIKLERMRKQVLLNAIIIALFVILLNLNILVYPGKDTKTRDAVFRARWIGFSSYALIDDNADFTSPIVVGNNEDIELEPGKYYLCIPFFSTCMKKTGFEIRSEVGIASRKLNAEGENATYLVENTGNVMTKIEIRNLLSRMITGFFILQPQANNVIEINESVEVIAEQND